MTLRVSPASASLSARQPESRREFVQRSSTVDLAPEWTPNPSAHTLSLPEQIAAEIGTEIISGRYEPGARIQEVEIATKFDVSRGPVREALRILERDGLVQINARRGASVTQLSLAELNDIFDPRTALNGLLGRKAAERQDRQAIDRLAVAVDRLTGLAEGSDIDSYTAAVYAAHRLMAEASGNAFLTRLVFFLAHQTLRYTRLALSTPQRRRESARNWRRVLAAIDSGDPAAAQAAAERLSQDSRDAALRLLSRQRRGRADDA